MGPISPSTESKPTEAGRRPKTLSRPAQRRLPRPNKPIVVGAGVSEARIRIGIGGWTYPLWRGVFYPDKLPQAKELEYASQQFGAIEINATFYGRQKPKSWATWAKLAPDDFQFAVKGSRYVVTRPRLADAEEGLGAYFAQGMAALGSKLGPILWML